MTADDPVSSTNQPCVETFRPRPFWGPPDTLVLSKHLVFEVSDFDEPLVRGSQYEWGLATPAMGI